MCFTAPRQLVSCSVLGVARCSQRTVTIPPGASGTWAGDSDQSISLLPGLCKTISARYGGGECKSSLFALAQWVWPIFLLHGAADIQVHRGWKQRILGSHRSTSNFNGFATLLRYACVCAKFSGSSAVCPAFSKALFYVGSTTEWLRDKVIGRLVCGKRKVRNEIMIDRIKSHYLPFTSVHVLLYHAFPRDRCPSFGS